MKQTLSLLALVVGAQAQADNCNDAQPSTPPGSIKFRQVRRTVAGDHCVMDFYTSDDCSAPIDGCWEMAYAINPDQYNWDNRNFVCVNAILGEYAGAVGDANAYVGAVADGTCLTPTPVTPTPAPSPSSVPTPTPAPTPDPVGTRIDNCLDSIPTSNPRSVELTYVAATVSGDQCQMLAYDSDDCSGTYTACFALGVGLPTEWNFDGRYFSCGARSKEFSEYFDETYNGYQGKIVPTTCLAPTSSVVSPSPSPSSGPSSSSSSSSDSSSPAPSSSPTLWLLGAVAFFTLSR